MKPSAKPNPPTEPQLTKLPPPKPVVMMPKSIVGEPPPPPKRSKGAPPPVIAKPKVKPKVSPTAGDTTKVSRKKIDFANAISVAAAAAQAAQQQRDAAYAAAKAAAEAAAAAQATKLAAKAAAASKAAKGKAGKGGKPAKGAKPVKGGKPVKGAKAPPPPPQKIVPVVVPPPPPTDGYVIISGRRVRVMSLKSIEPKKAAALKKEARATAAAAKKAETPAGIPEAPTADMLAKAAKGRFTKKELEEYRATLVRTRAELVGRVEGIESEALKSSDGNLSTMPLHMADIGTETFDQDFALGMAETDRHMVVEIDEALERIKAGTYGVCLMTAKPIPKGRLAAKPWAKYTVEAERIAERHRTRG
jgi:RNA polymerase-binding transcription factor DksA